MTCLLCMRLGAGQSGAILDNVHTVRRVAPISGEHLVKISPDADVQFLADRGRDATVDSKRSAVGGRRQRTRHIRDQVSDLLRLDHPLQ
jgi:hypothetical protein